MAYINEINGPNGIGNIGEPHKPIRNDENAGVFNAMLEEKIKLGKEIPDKQQPEGYTNEEKFIADTNEVVKIVDKEISKRGLSPPI
tara:strand:+ start:171 stop:428 length:258 start_codon:yes stop_codon:yes gene_type:complete